MNREHLNIDLGFLDKKDSGQSSKATSVSGTELDTYKVTVRKNGEQFVVTVKATSEEDAIRKANQYFFRKTPR